MELRVDHAIEDDKSTNNADAVSLAQPEQRKAEDKKWLQQVYNPTVHKRTSFDCFKICLMLHYEKPIQHFGHLVKDTTEVQEMNHVEKCIGPCC